MRIGLTIVASVNGETSYSLVTDYFYRNGTP